MRLGGLTVESQREKTMNSIFVLDAPFQDDALVHLRGWSPHELAAS